MARRWDYLRSTGRDLADVNRDTMGWFNQAWNDPVERMSIVPGKKVLRVLRGYLQEHFGVSLTEARIIENIRRDDVPQDLRELLEAVDGFRQSALDRI
jgi:hypothetical protein